MKQAETPSIVKSNDYLRQLRLHKGLSIRRVVMLSNGLLDKTTISRIERNERGVSVRALYALSNIYRVSADTILSQLMDVPVKIDLGTFDTSDEERCIIEQYRRLDSRASRLMRDLLGELTSNGNGKQDIFPYTSNEWSQPSHSLQASSK